MQNKRIPATTSLTIFAVGLALVMAACGQGVTDSEDLGAGATTSTPPMTVASTTTTTSGTVATTTTAPPMATTTTTAPPSQDVVEVLAYLLDPEPDPEDFLCDAVEPVTRLVEPPELLSGALKALLAGPTVEELGAGYGSWFSEETGWSVESVTITDGVAYIDFSEDSPLIPNASTSCGAMGLWAQLDSTAMQFPAVDEVVYSFGGDIAAFYHWLQADVPQA
jgi:spore germination protein GerM